MPYAIRLEQSLPRPLAVVRRLVTRSSFAPTIQQACGTVWNTLRAHNINPGRHITHYLDQSFNLEIGCELNAPIQPLGEVLPSSLPAAEVAATTHLGPYHLLGQAHDAILAWCGTNNRRPHAPCWEIYAHWDNAWNTNPSQIRTDIYYPLTPLQTPQ